ncbi:MAG TPA: glycoside hydrolase family 3 C-terminal domain-containing protein [Bacteroidales bacterium]|nr:glycoside hydrolase family 3 C-terminal domain-containing protein [Bacteroidales bacterium]
MKKVLFSTIGLLLAASMCAQTLDQQIDDIIAKMITSEKIGQLINNTFFTTGDNTRLGIPGFQMSDGPHGVRFGGATVFPVGIAMAASWDTGLIQRTGTAMGEEFFGYGKHQQLGPCLDLCRDPRNGRSPESSGEDPYLSGQIAAAVTRGIQQTPVIATAKHFNLVNRQQYRNNSNITISEQMLMDHYGYNFRMAVQEGGALSVMNAYNLINGAHCSENELLLQTILRDRWGFPGYVVSDWGAVHNSEKAIKAGTDICMGSSHYENDLLNLLNSGAITEETLNRAVHRVLKVKMLSGMMHNYPKAKPELINSTKHQQLALEAARKVMVLLKNQDNILPLEKDNIHKIALIGPSANKAQLDGFGSSWVEPVYTVSPRQGLEKLIGSSKVTYAFGCDINSADTSGFASARSAAIGSDVVIFIGGLDDTQEGEGYGDRPEYDRAGGSVMLPGKQQALINELSKVNKNIIVVLESGGICAVNNCIDNIKGLVYAFYPGEEGGNAIAEVLFGLYNPGGKLPVTMPKNDSQMPEWNDNFNDDYGCGYRWYDEKGYVPEFAFGFGLSYTTFTYTNISTSQSSYVAGHPVEISFDITNTGQVAGDEVGQLYIAYNNPDKWMPKKELKGFRRITLQPGETRHLKFILTAEDFYYWDESSGHYTVPDGNFTVKAGGSSDNLPLQATFDLVPGTKRPDLKITRLFTIPRFPVENDTVRFLALVRNPGAEDIHAGQAVDINFYVDDLPFASAKFTNVSIPAGGMAMIEANNGFWIAGNVDTVMASATVDPDNKLIESIETNNHIDQEVVVTDSITAHSNVNLALFKPVWATSSENAELLPENAVDGNAGTRWASAFSDPQTFVVDLEGLYDINRIRIQWETAYSRSFLISASQDSAEWIDVINEDNGDGGIDEITTDVKARYLKFEGLQRATDYGHSFWEFEVYGSAAGGGNGINLQPGETQEEVHIFPNPASDKLNVYFSQDNEKRKVGIFNIYGQQVFTHHLAGPGNIDIRSLKPGIYLLRIYSDHHRANTFRFIKE